MVEREKLLITGSTGFVGAHLLPKLLEEDEYDIHVLERYVTGRYTRFGKKVATHFADLRDSAALRNELKLLQPHIVIHLAAISPVSYSYDHPNEVMETNLQGTINLAETCRQVSKDLQHFIVAGTTEEYGITKDRPATEDSHCFPNSPYSVSKHAATEYLRFMFKAYGFPATISRSTNSYGRKDDNHFFVEKIASQMVTRGTKVVYLGDDQTYRDFMYVDDHVDAYLAILHHRTQAVGEIWNFSTGDCRKLNDVIRLMVEISGFKGELQTMSNPNRPLDIPHHSISSDKSRNKLGWRSKISLEVGLERTIDYWRNKLNAIPETTERRDESPNEEGNYGAS